jgi:betaine reductase
MNLKGKKVIALGERDGAPGSAIAACASNAGAEVVLGENLLLRLNRGRRA